MSEFSPSILNALNGLLVNQGIQVSSELTQILDVYTNSNLVKSFRFAGTAGNKLSDSMVFSKWNSFVSSIPKSITDSIDRTIPFWNGPEDSPNPIETVPTPLKSTTLSDAIREWANITIYNGDLSKFVQLFSTYRGQLTQVNSIIEPMSRVQSVVSQRAFKNSSYTMSGGASDLSSDLVNFGKDLVNSGYAIDFRYIEQLAVPSYLLANISERSGGIPSSLLSEFLNQNLSTEVIDLAINRDTVSNRDQAKIYRAFTQIRGNELIQILRIMRVSTNGLEQLSDLMSVKKLFPSSWETLTFRKAKQLFNIFSNGEIQQIVKDNVKFDKFVPQVPESIAIPLLVLSRNFRQIKDVKNFDPIKFGNMLQTLEVVDDLQFISELSNPTVELNSIQQTFGSGTGENGQYNITDVIGTIAGIPHSNNYRRIVEILQDLDQHTQLLQFHLTRLKNTILDEVYTVMIDPGDPGDPNAEPPIPPRDPTFQIVIPDVGSFPSSIPSDPMNLPNPPVNPYNGAVNALLDLAIPVLSEFLANYQEEITEMNELYDDSINKLIQEINFRNDIEAENNFAFSLLTSQRIALVSFAKSLHEYAQNSDLIEFFNLITDNTITGQAIVSSLREGKNIASYAKIGSLLNTKI
jgi:hypothetical protein